MQVKTTPPSDLETPGERIRWAISRTGSKLGVFAEQMGVRQQTLSRWLSPQSSPPTDGYLKRIADLTGVPAGWLRYGGDADEERPEDAMGHDPEPDEGGERARAEEAIADMPRVVRYLRSFDSRPDPQTMRLAAIRAWGEVFALQGGYPEWFIALREKVERGEF